MKKMKKEYDRYKKLNPKLSARGIKINQLVSGPYVTEQEAKRGMFEYNPETIRWKRLGQKDQVTNNFYQKYTDDDGYFTNIMRKIFGYIKLNYFIRKKFSPPNPQIKMPQRTTGRSENKIQAKENLLVHGKLCRSKAAKRSKKE